MQRKRRVRFLTGEVYTAYRLGDDSNFSPFIEGIVLIFNANKQPNTQDYVLIQIEQEIFVRQYTQRQ